MIPIREISLKTLGMNSHNNTSLKTAYYRLLQLETDFGTKEIAFEAVSNLHQKLKAPVIIPIHISTGIQTTFRQEGKGQRENFEISSTAFRTSVELVSST